MSYRAYFYGSYRSAFKGEGDARADHGRLSELYGAYLAPGLTKVVDLGAGTGELVEWLARGGVREAWGIDGSAEQVARARALGRDVREGDLFEALEREGPGSIDGVTAL